MPTDAVTTLPDCAAVAAGYYGVPLAIVEHVSSSTPHSGGIGPMGIQPGWLPVLEKAGFSPDAIKTDICMNIAAGAWILRWSGAAQQRKPPPDASHDGRPQPAFAPPGKLPPGLDACVSDAAGRYRLPEVLFRAILLTEGGQVGHISGNRNGSYDMGPAQVNSTHLPELARMGITREQVINDGCLNIQIGAWILARALNGQTPDNPVEFWRRVGNYNSSTPEYNRAYQAKVWKNVVAASHPQRPAG